MQTHAIDKMPSLYSRKVGRKMRTLDNSLGALHAFRHATSKIHVTQNRFERTEVEDESSSASAVMRSVQVRIDDQHQRNTRLIP